MVVHQYIGARYVPYYYENSLDPTSTEWEPNVNYEALTVVTLPNQHSYISKKAVPDTVGSPALNAEYWLDTGSNDAYIQNLQDQIDIINGTLTDIEHDVDVLESSGRFWYIGDSFLGLRPNNWGTYLDHLMGKTDSYYTSESAIGFVHPGLDTGLNLTQKVLSLSDVPTDIDTVIVIAGCNDTTVTYEPDIQTNMGTLVAAIKTKAPNVKKIYFAYNGTYQGTVYSDYANRIPYLGSAYHDMEAAAKDDKITGFIKSVASQLQSSIVLSSDTVHPSNTGSLLIAKCLHNVLIGAGENTVNFTRKDHGIVYQLCEMDYVSAWIPINTILSFTGNVPARIYTALVSGANLPYFPRDYEQLKFPLIDASCTANGSTVFFSGHILVRPNGDISLYSETALNNVTQFKFNGGSPVITAPLFRQHI